MSYATLGNTEILKLPKKWWKCLMMLWMQDCDLINGLFLLPAWKFVSWSVGFSSSGH